MTEMQIEMQAETSSTTWFEQLKARLKEKPSDNPKRSYRVLVVDLVGLQFDARGFPDSSAFAAHVRSRGARFISHADQNPEIKPAGLQDTSGRSEITFEYFPELSHEAELLRLTAEGQYDAVIAAATRIPPAARFSEGGVRIGAGTANMASESFLSGTAPLMNTPGFNSRATAQMVFKALLRVSPDLPLESLHAQVLNNRFDTGAHLKDFPTRKLEGLRFAVLGFGNIGREVALLARAFGMQVAVYGRSTLKLWIESEGFEYCATVREAARGASVLSPHLGLGEAIGDGYANERMVDSGVFAVLAPGAILVNFDRGELVDVAHLSAALESGQVGQVAVDADVFVEEGLARGPLQPYLTLLQEFSDRVLLLPHAAADTDHPSRVAGALQAADQIIAAIRYRFVVNGVGSLPANYVDGGTVKPKSVGRVALSTVDEFAEDQDAVSELRSQITVVNDWLLQLQASNRSGVTGSAQQALFALNRIATATRELGLAGPGTDI